MTQNTTLHTTLVFEPTATRPYIGLFAHGTTSAGRPTGRFLTKRTITVRGPGQFNFWPDLFALKKKLPPSRIVVITGPGPFTLTRAAVNIANGLGYAWDVPVVGMSKRSDLAAYLKQLPTRLTDNKFVLSRRALPHYEKPVQLGPRRTR